MANETIKQYQFEYKPCPNRFTIGDIINNIHNTSVFETTNFKDAYMYYIKKTIPLVSELINIYMIENDEKTLLYNYLTGILVSDDNVIKHINYSNNLISFDQSFSILKLEMGYAIKSICNVATVFHLYDNEHNIIGACAKIDSDNLDIRIDRNKNYIIINGHLYRG